LLAEIAAVLTFPRVAAVALVKSNAPFLPNSSRFCPWNVFTLSRAKAKAATRLTSSDSRTSASLSSRNGLKCATPVFQSVVRIGVVGQWERIEANAEAMEEGV